MIKRNPAKPTQETRQPRRWPTRTLILVCGLTPVSGFFLAGRQHFSSMDYGMKNSRLRKQIDDLQAEKRRLLLAREISLSPAEIKKAAKKVGFTDASEPEPELAKFTAPMAAPNSPATATNKDKAIPTSVAAAPQRPTIVRTSSVAATQKPVVASYLKADSRAERIVKPAKKTATAE